MAEIELPASYLEKAREFEERLNAESERSNWERRNPDTGEQYCKHGVNVGTWDGPDLMCGACEEGVSDHDWAMGQAYAMWRRDRSTVGRLVSEAITDTIRDVCVELGANPLTVEERMALVAPAMKLRSE